MYNLQIIYETGRPEEGINQDLELCAHYCSKIIDDEEFGEECKEKFLHLLSENLICWRKEYHQYWNKKNNLDDEIFTILLISKFRKFSKKKAVKFIMIKGIVMDIIKYLCHFQDHKLPEKKNPEKKKILKKKKK